MAPSEAVSGHTPGPWSVYAPPHDRSDMAWVAYPGIEGNGESVVVFGVRGEETGIQGATVERRVANARLIAAAPTLLAAAVRAEAIMAVLRPRSDTAEYLEAMHKLRDAIDKATQSEARQ